MILGRNRQYRKFDVYPYYGTIYSMTEVDPETPLDEREIEEVAVYESECDIQEVSKAANPTLIATYSVFFPFDTDDDIPIRAGMRFNGDMNGINVSGMITNVILSQIGGLVVYVKDYDADEGV